MTEPLACGLQILHQYATHPTFHDHLPSSMVPTVPHTQEPNDICIINEPGPSAMDDVL